MSHIVYASILRDDGTYESVPITDPRVIKETQLHDRLTAMEERIETLEKAVVAMGRTINLLEGCAMSDRRA